MYVTTFPCHLCARHIVAAGIKRVVYVEPYSKSLTAELYPDSIAVDGGQQTDHQIPFEPFVGVAPRQYMNLFKKGKRKEDDGKVVPFAPKEARLRYYEVRRIYIENELREFKDLSDAMKIKGII